MEWDHPRSNTFGAYDLQIRFQPVGYLHSTSTSTCFEMQLKELARREVYRRKLGKGLTSFDSMEIVSNCT